MWTTLERALNLLRAALKAEGPIPKRHVWLCQHRNHYATFVKPPGELPKEIFSDLHHNCVTIEYGFDEEGELVEFLRKKGAHTTDDPLATFKALYEDELISTLEQELIELLERIPES